MVLFAQEYPDPHQLAQQAQSDPWRRSALVLEEQVDIGFFFCFQSHPIEQIRVVLRERFVDEAVFGNRERSGFQHSVQTFVWHGGLRARSAHYIG